MKIFLFIRILAKIIRYQNKKNKLDIKINLNNLQISFDKYLIVKQFQ